MLLSELEGVSSGGQGPGTSTFQKGHPTSIPSDRTTRGQRRSGEGQSPPSFLKHTEHLLSAGHCARGWGAAGERPSPCPQGM